MTRRPSIEELISQLEELRIQEARIREREARIIEQIKETRDQEKQVQEKHKDEATSISFATVATGINRTIPQDFCVGDRVYITNPGLPDINKPGAIVTGVTAVKITSLWTVEDNLGVHAKTCS